MLITFKRFGQDNKYFIGLFGACAAAEGRQSDDYLRR